MQNTCQKKQFKPATLTGFIPICIRIQSLFAYFRMYMHVFDMYWFVYYNHDTDQYWQNGGFHAWFDWLVLVCMIMYCYVWMWIDMYRPRVACIYLYSASQVNFRMIRRPDHRPWLDVETSASRSWSLRRLLQTPWVSKPACTNEQGMVPMSLKAREAGGLLGVCWRWAPPKRADQTRAGTASSSKCEHCCATKDCFLRESSILL